MRNGRRSKAGRRKYDMEMELLKANAMFICYGFSFIGVRDV